MHRYHLQSRCSRFLGTLYILYSLACGGNGCADLQTWCPTNKNFCHFGTMKSVCPFTCNMCLPEECRATCRSHNCTVDSEGSVKCLCDEGYRLNEDGRTCEDVDECAENILNCPNGTVCRNAVGHANCESDICIAFRNQNFIPSISYEDKCCDNSNLGQCGRNNVPSGGKKIIGGENSMIEFWPWQAFFYLQLSQKCGGSLIDDSWVISAAHCFENYNLDDIASYNITVLFGLKDTEVVTSLSTQPRRVVEVIVPDGYKFPNNDIALVRLDRPIARSNFVSPVCLPNGETPPTGLQCYITGFGTTDATVTTLPRVVQQANVSIVDDEICRLAYDGFEHKMDPTTMICAGYKEGGKDACQGDSGGPLVCQRCNSCDWFLAGVTSYGRGCGKPDAYGVYTRVEYFENWIASKIASVDVTKQACEPTRWGEWGQWSDCSGECSGTQTRSRQCLNGIPGIPGCEGEDTESRVCTLQNQRNWSTWSDCSLTCGGGQQTRTRNCMGPDLKTRTQRRECNTKPGCLNWSTWTSWTPCPSLCGQDDRMRTRSCVGGNIGDLGCEGSARQEEKCVPDPTCTEFGPWSEWSPCSKTCGGGTSTATRECNGVMFGLSCIGEAIKIQTCSTPACRQFTQWSLWTECDKSCGGGERSRFRSCVGGDDCSGDLTDTKVCNSQTCILWSEWSEWSACSQTCGGGSRTRSRICGDGFLDVGMCQGPANGAQLCNTDLCEDTSTCSDFCVTYVESGYCSPQYKDWMAGFCGTGCCTPRYCQNKFAQCDLYDISSCGEQNFARNCLRKCGYCA